MDFRTERVKSKLDGNSFPLLKKQRLYEVIWLYEVVCVRSTFLDSVLWYELLVSEGVEEGQWI